jgi:hypothetical protein
VNSPISVRASVFLSAAHEPTPMEGTERHRCVFLEERSTRAGRLPRIDNSFQFRDKSICHKPRACQETVYRWKRSRS